MKRTTLALDDDLLRQLKERAAREGTTLQALANSLLRHALARRSKHEYKIHFLGWTAEARPGVDLFDRDALLDLMDGR
jgi:plasmid stability protein